MSDLIDKGVLVGKTEILYQFTESGKIIPWAAVRVCEINNIPTVEAEPVRHGEWVGGELGYCTCCGHKGCASDIWNGVHGDWFCPNCGAKMGGEKDA